ncbi:MAG: NADH-quinone oxidoreductase subunit I [Candidatus Tectomicrobia bacterium]
MLDYFINIWDAIWTPLVGMRLTWKRLFRPAVTLQYPDERWELPSGSRMQLFVNMDDCIGCAQCERVCPVNCITIETVKAVPDDVEETSTGHKIRLHTTVFDIDMAKCCYCNLCVYPCPTECIYMTSSFEDAAPDRFDLLYHFAQIPPAQARELEAKSRAFDAAEEAKKAAREQEKAAAAAGAATE